MKNIANKKHQKYQIKHLQQNCHCKKKNSTKYTQHDTILSIKQKKKLILKNTSSI